MRSSNHGMSKVTGAHQVVLPLVMPNAMISPLVYCCVRETFTSSAGCSHNWEVRRV